jgi:hypothetical protein
MTETTGNNWQPLKMTGTDMQGGASEEEQEDTRGRRRALLTAALFQARNIKCTATAAAKTMTTAGQVMLMPWLAALLICIQGTVASSTELTFDTVALLLSISLGIPARKQNAKETAASLLHATEIRENNDKQ